MVTTIMLSISEPREPMPEASSPIGTHSGENVIVHLRWRGAQRDNAWRTEAARTVSVIGIAARHAA